MNSEAIGLGLGLESNGLSMEGTKNSCVLGTDRENSSARGKVILNLRNTNGNSVLVMLRI